LKISEVPFPPDDIIFGKMSAGEYEEIFVENMKRYLGKYAENL